MPTSSDPKRLAALDGIRAFLDYLGEDPAREGLRETPERFLRAWEYDWGAGYRDLTINQLIKLFPQEDDHTAYDQMVLVKNIVFHSHCEHHLAPFFGEAHVAYIPSGVGIVGISKLARVVDHFSRRLQVQERLTEQIADFLEMYLSENCAITMTAAHMCMVSRGVRQPNTKTVTTALRGVFRQNVDPQQEFLRKTER